MKNRRPNSVLPAPGGARGAISAALLSGCIALLLNSAAAAADATPAWPGKPRTPANFDYFQALPDKPLVPENNPLTPAKAALGKMLFFDPRLSADGTLSCNSCHTLTTGANDGRALSTGNGGRKTRRSSPTLLNIGLQTVYYWDGRALSLEDLFQDHIAAPDIMGMSDFARLQRRLARLEGYRSAFSAAFGPGAGNVTVSRMAQAVASFVRTLMTPNSRYDRFVKGDANAQSALEHEGMELFRNVGCLSCHFGVNFAGPAPGPAIHLGEGFYELFPNHVGTEYDGPMHLLDDPGIFGVSGNPADKRLWRVPPLRNIALSAPYFHNGAAPDLETAIRVMAMTQYKRKLKDGEIRAIKAFLVSLTGEQPVISLPHLPLEPGRSIHDPGKP